MSEAKRVSIPSHEEKREQANMQASSIVERPSIRYSDIARTVDDVVRRLEVAERLLRHHGWFPGGTFRQLLWPAPSIPLQETDERVNAEDPNGYPMYERIVLNP